MPSTMDNKFKVGDRVRVKNLKSPNEFLKLGTHTISFPNNMMQFAGVEDTISAIGHIGYSLKKSGSNWLFDENWLEPALVERKVLLKDLV